MKCSQHQSVRTQGSDVGILQLQPPWTHGALFFLAMFWHHYITLDSLGHLAQQTWWGSNTLPLNLLKYLACWELSLHPLVLEEEEPSALWSWSGGGGDGNHASVWEEEESFVLLLLDLNKFFILNLKQLAPQILKLIIEKQHPTKKVPQIKLRTLSNNIQTIKITNQKEK